MTRRSPREWSSARATSSSDAEEHPPLIVVVEQDALSQEALRGAAGSGSIVVRDLDEAYRQITDHPEVDVVLIGPHVDLESALDLAEGMRLARPTLGVVL